MPHDGHEGDRRRAMEHKVEDHGDWQTKARGMGEGIGDESRQWWKE